MSTRQSPRKGARSRLYVAMALCGVHVGVTAFFDFTPQLGIGAAQAADAAKGTLAANAKEGEEFRSLRKYSGELPPAVIDMREALLAAADMGDIAELKHAIELNELRPDFGDEAKDDPIAFWKKASGDGEGRDILAQIASLLALPPAKVALGKNPEDTAVFVWPYFAELPLDTLKPGELVDAYRLVTPAQFKDMAKTKRWAGWRLVISADGTWVSFKR